MAVRNNKQLNLDIRDDNNIAPRASRRIFKIHGNITFVECEMRKFKKFHLNLCLIFIP